MFAYWTSTRSWYFRHHALYECKSAGLYLMPLLLWTSESTETRWLSQLLFSIFWVDKCISHHTIVLITQFSNYWFLLLFSFYNNLFIVWCYKLFLIRVTKWKHFFNILYYDRRTITLIILRRVIYTCMAREYLPAVSAWSDWNSISAQKSSLKTIWTRMSFTSC